MQTSWLAKSFGVLAALFLLVFLVYPVGVILSQSFSDVQGLFSTLRNPFYYGRLWFTVWQALLSTLLTVVLALPSAVLFSRYEFAGKRFLRSVFLIPFVMPTVVVAIGFLTLAGPRGLVTIDLKDSLWIILLAHVFYNYAIVVRIVSSFLENNLSRLYEAAKTLGSSRFHTLFRVTLPLALPAIVAAATLVFIFCFTSFGVILILAPSAEFATLELEIFKLSSRLLNLSGAGYLVLVQLVVISVFTFVYTRLQAGLALSLGAKRVPLSRPKGLARVWLGLHFGVVGLLLLSPLLALLWQSFFFEGSFGFESFAYAWQGKRSIGFAGATAAIVNSLKLAAYSMSLALLVGFAFAYGVVRARWVWLDQASLLPLSISAVTVGFGYLLAFPQLRTSVWGLILAHTLIAFPFVTRSLLPALRGMPGNLLSAGRSLGASPLRILREIELPLLLPAFVSAASFAFAISMGEFAATLTLQSVRFATLPVAIFDRLSRPGIQNYAAALALACILMLITGLVMFALERFGESEF